MIRMAWTMSREHRASSIGIGAVMIFAMTLFTATASALAAVTARDGIAPVAGASEADRQRLQLLFEGSASFLGTTLLVTGFVTVFMVATTTSFAIAERRGEISLLRLTGATSGQVRRLTLVETLIVGVLCSVAGAGLGSLLAWPLLDLLAGAGLGPVGVVPQTRWWLLLVCAGTGIVIAALGAWVATRSITRITPVEALGNVGQARRTMPLARWIVGALAAAVVVLVLVLPIDVGEFQTMTLLVAFAAMIGLTALAPVLVPPLSRLFGGPAAGLAPATGLLAAARTRWAAQRTAALAVPVLVLMGISGPLFMIAQTSAAMNQARYGDALTADLVIDTAAHPATAEQLAQARNVPGISTLTQLVTSAGWTYRSDAPGDAWVSWLSPRDIDRVAQVTVLAGSLDALDGTTVATTDRNAHVGDTDTIMDPAGNQLTVTIGAVIASTSVLQAEILAPENFAPELQTPQYIVRQQTWATFASNSDHDQVTGALHTILPNATIQTKAAWLAEGTSAAQASQAKGLIAMIGAGVLLAAFSMAQTTLNGLRERRGEFALLRTLGTSRRQVHATVLGETVLVLLTAGILIAALLMTTYIRLDQMLAHVGSAITPAVPLPLLLAVFAGCAAVTILTGAGGVTWALRTPRLRRRHFGRAA